MILRCYFCFKKISHEIQKEKKNTTCLSTILNKTIEGVIVAATIRKSKSSDLRRIKGHKAERSFSGMKRLKPLFEAL